MSPSVLLLVAVGFVSVAAKQSGPDGSTADAAIVTLPESAATPAVEAVTPSDAPTPEELREEAVLRERRRVQRTHRTLGISTWGSVVTTQALTTALALNQRTLFGPGSCSTSVTAATDFGCGQALLNIRDFSGLIS